MLVARADAPHSSKMYPCGEGYISKVPKRTFQTRAILHGMPIYFLFLCASIISSYKSSRRLESHDIRGETQADHTSSRTCPLDERGRFPLKPPKSAVLCPALQISQRQLSTMVRRISWVRMVSTLRRCFRTYTTLFGPIAKTGWSDGTRRPRRRSTTCLVLCDFVVEFVGERSSGGEMREEWSPHLWLILRTPSPE